MDAFIEIIEKLVDNVSPQTWLDQNHFPFKFLKKPQAKLHDVCLFNTSVHGVYGFLWISFLDTDDLLIFPFSLARYKEDGDLISLTPWSLRNASSDHKFYETWRTALKNCNPLPTAQHGQFFHKKYPGEPAFVALDIWSDARSTCVRLDFQIAYKIFRIVEKQYPHSIEVEFLTYLGGQSMFTHFAKLISVFEYRSSTVPLCHIGMGLKYVKNNGPLFPLYVSLLHKARFPKRFKQRASQQAWQQLLQFTESMGRLLGDFHKAMSQAPRTSLLAPEQNTQESREAWLAITCQKLDERLAGVLALQEHYPSFSGLFYLLPSHGEKIKETLKSTLDIGLRIRNHGNMNLGQILMGVEDLVLLDYDADDFDEPLYRRIKHPSMKDYVAMIISLRFAWHFTERQHYALFADDNQQALSQQSLPDTREQIVVPEKYTPSLSELESTFQKFYKNSLHETITSSQLRPKSSHDEKNIYNFYFFTTLLKEITRENPAGNPRPRIWLHILQDFIMQNH